MAKNPEIKKRKIHERLAQERDDARRWRDFYDVQAQRVIRRAESAEAELSKAMQEQERLRAQLQEERELLQLERREMTRQLRAHVTGTNVGVRQQVNRQNMGPIVRFEIVHEDGTIVRYEGDDAQRHAEALNDACRIAMAHGKTDWPTAFPTIIKAPEGTRG